MHIFAILAGMMALFLLLAGRQQPRLGVFVAAILWLLYAVYEYHVATGVLCDSDCNIRVDLVLLFPILGIATWYAYRAYVGPPGQSRVLGMVLGVIGLIVAAALAAAFGYEVLAGLACAGALAIVVYAIKSGKRRVGGAEGA